MNNPLIKRQFPNETGPVAKSASTAKALLLAAQIEAEQILNSARQEALEIINVAKSQTAIAENRRTIRERVATLHVWRQAVVRAKEDLLTCSETLAQSILLTEISLTPTSILNRVEAASEIVNDLTAATLELSKEEESKLKERLSHISQVFSIKINSSLKPGEFILSTKRAQIKSFPLFHLENLIQEIGSLAPSFRQLALKIIPKGNHNEY